MSKRDNPLLKKTAPDNPVDKLLVDYNDADWDALGDAPLTETFPGVKPLSVREKKRLTELEGVVTRNFKAFYEVGCALREIQASQLYRETHTTFADYAKDLWDMARRTAYQYIEAVDIVDRLIPVADKIKNVRNCAHTELIPQNEAQARALSKYPADKQVEIWREAVETADGRITAAHVRRTAVALHGRVVKERIKRAKRQTREPGAKISDGFMAAFDALLDSINVERENGWKNTDRDEVARYLRGLLQAVEAPL